MKNLLNTIDLMLTFSVMFLGALIAVLFFGHVTGDDNDFIHLMLIAVFVALIYMSQELKYNYLVVGAFTCWIT